MQELLDHLSSVSIDSRLSHRNLEVFPIVAQSSVKFEYDTLEDALGKETVSVREVSHGGSVPELLLVNDNALPVLILDGEELVGAKQNRIVNLTIMAPAKSSLKIPVSCVEAGRWDYVSTDFAASERTVYSSLRARKGERVSMNMAACSSRHADQGEIWADIAFKSARMGSRSPTGAMALMYQERTALLNEFVDRLKVAPDQLGAVFAISGRIVGFDLMDKPSTWSKLYPKLLSGYALDALDDGATSPIELKPEMAKEFVGKVSETRQHSYPALGEGTDVRIEGSEITGSALVVEGVAVHVCAFARHPRSEFLRHPDPRFESRMSRASVRSRYRGGR